MIVLIVRVSESRILFVLQVAGTAFILDSVIMSLRRNPNHTFVYAEMVRQSYHSQVSKHFICLTCLCVSPGPSLASSGRHGGNNSAVSHDVLQAFFIRWWQEQDSSMRTEVQRLVSAGQLSFVNGGYVQNDEAASHYVAMIDQMTLGHRCRLGNTLLSTARRIRKKG